MAVRGDPPLPERRSAAGGGGAGPGSRGPEPERRDRSWGRSFGTSGAAHRDPRRRRRAPLSNPTSPRSVPVGRSRPPGVTWRRQSLILLPGRSLRAAVPPGTGRHPPPRPGPTSPSLGVGAASREAPRACARAAALAILPAVLQPPPRPPSSRVTRVDLRRGTRAGPWRSR